MTGDVGPVPDPAVVPTCSVEEAAAWLGLGRSAAYECARHGELPVIHLGRRLRVPTARLRVLLGLDAEPVEEAGALVVPIRRGGA